MVRLQFRWGVRMEPLNSLLGNPAVYEQLKRVIGLLKRVRYKVGVEFSAYPYAGMTVVFKMGSWYRDADLEYPPEAEEELPGLDDGICVSSERAISAEYLSELSDKEIIEQVVWVLIREHEEHEMEEWYRFDGVRVREPYDVSPVPKVRDSAG